MEVILLSRHKVSATPLGNARFKAPVGLTVLPEDAHNPLFQPSRIPNIPEEHSAEFNELNKQDTMEKLDREKVKHSPEQPRGEREQALGELYQALVKSGIPSEPHSGRAKQTRKYHVAPPAEGENEKLVLKVKDQSKPKTQIYREPGVAKNALQKGQKEAVVYAWDLWNQPIKPAKNSTGKERRTPVSRESPIPVQQISLLSSQHSPSVSFPVITIPN
jgi:hypothetical protein